MREQIQIWYFLKNDPAVKTIVVYSQAEVDDVVQKIVQYGYHLYSVERSSK